MFEINNAVEKGIGIGAYAFECTIIGTPVLTLTGAALAFDAFRQESCCDDLDEWLLEAIGTFMRPHMGEAAHA